MIDLRPFLESQREQIVNFIQQHFIPANITSESTFTNIANKLQTEFIHNHRGEIGRRDQAHNVLAMAIICSMWCGLSIRSITKFPALAFAAPNLVGIDLFRSIVSEIDLCSNVLYQ